MNQLVTSKLQGLKRLVKSRSGGGLHAEAVHARYIRSNASGLHDEILVVGLDFKLGAIAEREANSGLHEQTAPRNVYHVHFRSPRQLHGVQPRHLTAVPSRRACLEISRGKRSELCVETN